VFDKCRRRYAAAAAAARLQLMRWLHYRACTSETRCFRASYRAYQGSSIRNSK